MKKFLIFAIVLLIAAVAVVQYSGVFQTDPGDLTLAEAEYSVRTQKTTNSTPFLVGKFLTEDGSRLMFDGSGTLTHIAANFQETEGSYTLTQAEDGTAVLWMDQGSGREYFTFRLTSPDGEITLRDAANIEHVLTPVE